MKRFSNNFILNVLIPFSAGVFLFGCAAVDRVTQPTAKSTSPEGAGPTIEQAKKEDYMGPKARVAVTRFEDKSAKGKATGQIGDGMAEMLSNALFKTNRFIVLERGAVGDVLKEQDFGASGHVKPETAAKIGEIEGADLLIFGTITEFEPGTTGAKGGKSVRPPWRRGIPDIFYLRGEIRTSHVAMIVKVIEVRTARVLASDEVEGKATDIMGLGDLGGGDFSSVFSGYSKTPMEKAIRVAIKEAVRHIVAKTPPEFYRHSTIPQPKPVTPLPNKTPEASIPSTTPPPPPPPPPPPSTRVTQVTKDIENLREGPGTNFKIVGKIRKGTSLEILEDKGDWLRVRLEDGINAWIWRASTSEAPAKPSSDQPRKPKSPM